MNQDFLTTVGRSVGSAIRIVRELGGAGMARVFLADDVALGRSIVVKVLPPERAGAMSAERFRREIQTVAKLQHANIVPVLTAGEGDGLLWFTMPFVAGASLRDRLTAVGALSVPETLSILRDVARALAFAHQQGVLHRDIKPDNVLLSGGAAVVTDFGIAKAMSAAVTADPDSSLTVAGSSLGTPRYMAPEQISGDPDLDHRADLYAFGVMAYEMLAGRTPFHDVPPQAMLKAHLTDVPPPLSVAAPATPPALVRIVMQCLEKAPDARPASAAAILSALDAVSMSGEITTQAAPATPRNETRSYTMRAVAVLGAIGAVALVAWGVLRGRDGDTLNPSLIAVAPFRIATAERSLDYLREGMLDIFAAKLPGEGGAQVLDPRAMLAAWYKALPPGASELSHEDAARVARSLGAGRLVLGDIISGGTGNGSRVEIGIRVLQSGDASETFRTSVAGSADSIPALVDALGARLLAELAPNAKGAAAQLARVPLVALRAYLDGVRQLRALVPLVAVADFRRALAADSTFALAGIGLVMAADWYGDPSTRRTGLDAAWAHQSNLAERDRLLLRAIAGPGYPRTATTRELLAAREAFARAAPDRADATYLLADLYFHEGFALGERDPLARAREGFERAMTLDSLYVPGYAHALEIAIADGDDRAYERFARLRGAADTAQSWRSADAWFRAAKRGDTIGTARAWSTVEATGDGSLLYTMGDYATYDGIGMPDALRATAELARLASGPGQRGLYSAAYNTFMVGGEPGRAQEFMESAWRADGRMNPAERELVMLTAIFGEGDSSVAARAASLLDRQIAQAPNPNDSAAVANQRGRLQSRALWRLFRHDTAGARADATALHALAALPVSRAGHHPSVIAAQLGVDAWLAATTNAPDAGTRLARLDSALANYPYGTTGTVRIAALNLLTARLYERRGDVQRALTAAMRRSMRRGAGAQPFYSVHAFEIARLAAAAGDTAFARANYELFLRYRPAPDSLGRGKNEEARQALARLSASPDR